MRQYEHRQHGQPVVLAIHYLRGPHDRPSTPCGVGTLGTVGTASSGLVLPVPPSQRCGLCQNFKQTTLTTRLHKVRTNLYPAPHLRKRSDASVSATSRANTERHDMTARSVGFASHWSLSDFIFRSTQPCIPPGLLNRVPASAGLRAGMSPLPGGR